MKTFPTSRLRIPALAACFLALAIPSNAAATAKTAAAPAAAVAEVPSAPAAAAPAVGDRLITPKAAAHFRTICDLTEKAKAATTVKTAAAEFAAIERELDAFNVHLIEVRSFISAEIATKGSSTEKLAKEECYTAQELLNLAEMKYDEAYGHLSELQKRDTETAANPAAQEAEAREAKLREAEAKIREAEVRIRNAEAKLRDREIALARRERDAANRSVPVRTRLSAQEAAKLNAALRAQKAAETQKTAAAAPIAAATDPIIGRWHCATAKKKTAASSADAKTRADALPDGKVRFAANGKIVGHPRFIVWAATAVPNLYRISEEGCGGGGHFLARRTDTALEMLYVADITFNITSIDGLVSLVKAGFAFEDLANINGNRIEPFANQERAAVPAAATAAGVSTTPLPGFFVSSAPRNGKGKPSVLAFFENRRVNGNGEFWAWEPAPANGETVTVSPAADGSVAAPAAFIPGTYLLTRRDDKAVRHIAQLTASGELRVLYPACKLDALGSHLARLQSGDALSALAARDGFRIRFFGKHAPNSAALAALLSGNKPAASKAADSKPAAASGAPTEK